MEAVDFALGSFYSNQEKKLLEEVFADDYFSQIRQEQLSKVAKHRLQMIRTETVMVEKKLMQDNLSRLLVWPSEQQMMDRMIEAIINEKRE